MSLRNLLVQKANPQFHTALCGVLDSLGASHAPIRGIRAGQRFDAGETMLFSRMLESVAAEVYRTEFPDFMIRKLVPLIPGIPAGADTYTWRRRKQVGNAKWIANGVDDLPNVSGSYVEDSCSIKPLGISFQYTVMELLGAQMANVPLQSDLAVDAREAVERLIDEVGALGDSAQNMGGLLNGVDRFGVSLLSPTGYNGHWGGVATGATMLEDLQMFAQSVWVNSKGVASAKRLVIDTASYSEAATTPYSATVPDTVLSVFLASNPTVREVIPWSRCNLADAELNGPRWLAYDPDPSALGLVLPVEYSTQPPQAQNLYIRVPGFARFGGVAIRKPLYLTYLDTMRD